MNGMVERACLEEFRAALGRRLGFQFDDGRLGELEGLLRWRLDAAGVSDPGEYLQALFSGRASTVDAGEEWRALVEKITVSETYFFRNLDQFRAFADIVLSAQTRPSGSARPLRLLSAGCSTGDEAYSLAIIVKEHPGGLTSPGVAITAIDVNPAILEKARRARYPAWSLRETPEPLRGRYFSAHGAEFRLDERVRAMVSFHEKNILDADPAFWQANHYDAVFCRNMLMYFSPEAARAAVARLYDAMAPGACLFLGSAETLRGLSADFHLCHTHGTFYYQKPRLDEGARARRQAAASSSGAWAASPPGAVAYTAPEPAATWVDTIRAASERIAGLARDSAAGASPAAPPASGKPAGPNWSLGGAMELLRRERFQEALELLSALPPEATADPDVRLLTAVLLTNGGRLEAAEALCRDLLAADDLNAGAHYLMALCRESAGDLAAALEHDQTAAYLDAAFAMPRLHMGLAAKRAGDRDTGRHRLECALALLEREDAARILLFGGGFTREALIGLCASELKSLTERS